MAALGVITHSCLLPALHACITSICGIYLAGPAIGLPAPLTTGAVPGGHILTLWLLGILSHYVMRCIQNCTC